MGIRKTGILLQCHSCARLILYSILNCRWDDLLALVGVLCSTWVAVNSGTSQRDFLTPMGHPEFPSVQCGNQMVSRWGASNPHIYIYIVSPTQYVLTLISDWGLIHSIVSPKDRHHHDRNKLIISYCSLKICFGGPLHYRGWWGAYSGESSIKSDYASRSNGVASSTTIKIQDRGAQVALVIDICKF